MSKAKEVRRTSAKRGSAGRDAVQRKSRRSSPANETREPVTPESDDGRGVNSDEQRKRVNQSEDSKLVGRSHKMNYYLEEEDEEKTYQQTQKMRLEDDDSDEDERDLTREREE